jgi:chemotaxis protein CheZ
MVKAVSVSPELQRQVDSLPSRQSERVTASEITVVVEGIMATLNGDLDPAHLKLYNEIEALARFIQSAKAEIAAVRPDEIAEQDIPLATDELDAVVGATEEATGTILDACETLERLSGEMPPAVAEQVSATVTKVYEACNFQDITGQRINKVVKTLKHIEGRVSAMLLAFGEEVAKQRGVSPAAASEPAAPAAAPAKAADASLLNGPQLPDEAKRQAEIDAILASFD